MKLQSISFIIVISTTALPLLLGMPGVSFAQRNRNPSPTSSPSASPTPSSPSDVTSRIIYAPPQNFFCDVRDRKNEKGEVVQKDVPTTMAKTAKGEVVTYFWTKPFYPDSGETPLSRCTRVAQVLSQFIKQGNLNLISLGNRNGTSAICVVGKTGNSCSKLIFPLEADEDPESVLEDLREAMKGLPIATESVRRTPTSCITCLILPRTTIPHFKLLPNGVPSNRGGAGR